MTLWNWKRLGRLRRFTHGVYEFPVTGTQLSPPGNLKAEVVEATEVKLSWAAPVGTSKDEVQYVL